MQSPEETFFERIAAIIVPLHMARHNRKWDSARGARRDSGRTGERPASAQESHVLRRHGGGCLWKEEEKGTKRINQERFDQINAASPQTLRLVVLFA
jgi:hypothetical protein